MKLKSNQAVLSGIICLLIAIILAGYFYFFANKNVAEKSVDQSSSCPIETETRTVRGKSMTGLVEENANIKILKGYYNCHKVQRGDLIALSYAGNDNPLLKTIKGIPGDKLDLKNDKEKWQIEIDGQIVVNSEQKTYELGEKEKEMLALYIKDYQGKIPPNAYLVLGNLVEGSIDSTRFGLIDKKEILGKAER